MVIMGFGYAAFINQATGWKFAIWYRLREWLIKKADPVAGQADESLQTGKLPAAMPGEGIAKTLVQAAWRCPL